MFTPNAVAGSPPVAYYFHVDHLDAPRLVVNTGGQKRWRWLAEPFGTTVPESNPDGLGVFTQNLRLPGQYADQESGLFYNYFRDYDASLGRYAQSDPIGLKGGINTYEYVGSDPLQYVDPRGLEIVCVMPFGCAYRPPPIIHPDFPSTPAPSLSWPKPVPDWFVKQIVAWCMVSQSEADKQQCDKEYEDDLDDCHDNYASGLRGAGFKSAWKACLDHAERRRNACYKGESNPGPFNAGPWIGGRKR
jgi:RHS repeat-associated protein